MRSYLPDPEIKHLTAEVARLRAENDHLKSLVAKYRDSELVRKHLPKAATKATGNTKRSKAVHSGRASHIA